MHLEHGINPALLSQDDDDFLVDADTPAVKSTPPQTQLQPDEQSDKDDDIAIQLYYD